MSDSHILLSYGQFCRDGVCDFVEGEAVGVDDEAGAGFVDAAAGRHEFFDT